MPRKSSERITPELPRAPRSSAEATQPETSSTVEKLFFRSSTAALPIVRPMFVPVSPSGTGKTLSSFIVCMFACSAASAQRIMSRNAAASM